MQDLISRQAAINLLKKWADGCDYIENETKLAIKEFQELPSAQPDCSDCSKHGGDWDCDHVHCHKGESAQPKSVNLKIEKIKKHRADFSDLDEFEPCEAKEMNDTIYRQDAIDALITEWNKELKTTWECGEEMYVCPRCGRFVPMDMNFCGYCGVYLSKEKYC